jgi:hypothetical protein
MVMFRKCVVLVIGAMLLALACCAALAPTAGAYPAGWTLQQQVVAGDAAACDVTAFANFVWLAWRTSSTGSIWVRKSADFGATWGPGVCLDNGAYPTGNPVVVVGASSAQLVYVMFPSSRDGGGYYQLQLYQGTSFGDAWARTYVSGGATNKAWVDAARAPDSGTIFYTYTDSGSGADEIYWGKVANNGSVTPGTVRSAVDGIASTQPSIAANGYANAMIVWAENSGGGWTRQHLEECHTGDGGDNWTTQFIPDNDHETDYRQIYPSVAWDNNSIAVVYMGIVVADGSYYVGRYGTTPMGYNWSPLSAAASIYQNTGSVACYPQTTGRFSADIFYKNTTSQLSEHGVSTDVLGPKTLASAAGLVSVTSADFSSDTAIDYMAAITSSGEVYLRRKDTVDPTANITTPAFSGSDPVYYKANFPVECLGAADDFNVGGTDLQTGIVYHNGIASVTYTSTEDEATWHDLQCVGGTNVVTTPPFSVTVNANPYNQARIKIKAVAVDSAGNSSEYITPGWIYVDLDKPVSSLSIAGTKGDNGFYRSNAQVTIACTDISFDHSEYQLENIDKGQKDSNWTTYINPFALAEGHWKVYYRSIDKAGNVEATKVTAVNVDKTPPLAFVTRPDKGVIQTGYYNDETFRLSGTGTDENGLEWASIWVDGKMLYQTTSAFNMSYVWKLAGQTEKTHNIVVKVKDRAGNLGASSKGAFVGNIAKDWYFAEGNTLPEFDEWLCVLNPGDNPATYQITFMLEDGTNKTAERSMAPHQRDTVRVKDYIGDVHTGVSVKIHSNNQAVVAERPMYFHYKQGVPGYSWKGGHDVMGVNLPQKDWYFAEGTTRMNDADHNQFEEWITLMNPDANTTANVLVTYMLGTGANVERVYPVAPHSRYTVDVARDIGINQDVSLSVHCDNVPIVAERPMYFDYHRYAFDGSNVVGALSPQTQWYFGEGCTRPGYSEWLTIQNPNAVAAECDIKYLAGSGKTNIVHRSIKPRSRDTVNVLANVGSNQDVSTVLTSNVPVIAERPMYYIYGQGVAGRGWNGGDSTLGNPDPSTQYFLAEGTTISNFDTYYTLLNPSDTKGCGVKVQYIFGDGSSQEESYYINAHSRLTINVREAIKGKEANVSGSIIADFPVSIERPMYFNYDNSGLTGGHDVGGYGVD